MPPFNLVKKNMKISKLFHWLYACVMFLPLLILPIFAIYIINHEPTPLSIDTEQYEVIDFNQKIQNGNFENGINNFGYNGSNVVVNTSDISWTATTQYAQFYASSTQCTLNDKYLVRVTLQGLNNFTNNIRIYKGNTFSGTSFNIGQETKICEFIATAVNEVSNPLYLQNNASSDFNSYLISNFQMFNLTQMFGAGNEPTLEQFNLYFPNDYYNYTLSRTELLDVGYVTLDDTDLGSQYIYSLYNVVDKYFNFTSFVPFERLYSWFVLVVFSASVPLGFTILYNLMIYWLFISLIWLMFDVFMYVPLIVHNMIDKARIE